MDERFTVHLPAVIAAVVHCPCREVMKWVISGRIVPGVEFVYPLEQARGMRVMKAGSNL